MGFQNGWRGPNIVSDGLVLYLDAGSPNSYRPDFGTTWKDMSGFNNSGSLTNGPSFDSASGGSIVFDGTNDYVNQNLNTGSFTTEATLIMFLKLVNATPSIGSETGIERLSANASKEASHYPYIDGLAYLGTFQTGGTRINGITLSSTINRTQWHMITISSSPGTDNWKFYQNTELIKTAIGSNTVYFSPDGVYNIGRSQTYIGSAFWYCRGSIANILLYNKALTQQEINQNYNVLKSRLGL